MLARGSLGTMCTSVDEPGRLPLGFLSHKNAFVTKRVATLESGTLTWELSLGYFEYEYGLPQLTVLSGYLTRPNIPPGTATHPACCSTEALRAARHATRRKTPCDMVSHPTPYPAVNDIPRCMALGYAGCRAGVTVVCANGNAVRRRNSRQHSEALSAGSSYTGVL